jgi:hypothetical protein
MHCAPKPAWRSFQWRNNRCFGFQSIIYYYHPMVILSHFNFFILKLHQRNLYNRHLLLFFTSEDVNKCIVVDNNSLMSIALNQISRVIYASIHIFMICNHGYMNLVLHIYHSLISTIGTSLLGIG